MCKWLNDIAVKSTNGTWLALRVVAGLMFAIHGAQKLFGWFGGEAASFTGGMGIFGVNVGLNMIWLAGFIEFVGGLLLVLGLLTRWTALVSALLMFMAYVHAHPGINPIASGGELAVMYFLVFLVLFAYGPGKWSIDEKYCKK